MLNNTLHISKQLSRNVCDYKYVIFILTHAIKMSDTKTQEIAQLKEQVEALKATLSRARIVKEHSDFFRNKESDTEKLYKNLSETAKSVEKNAPAVLEAMKIVLTTRLINISDFNKEVIKGLKQLYNV